MGFRNPVTSATDVDTGGSSVPSVYMTQGGDTLTGATFGEVGFRDGFTTADALITRQVGASGHDASLTGGLQLTGGGYGPGGGIRAPELDLSVTSDGPGSWTPTATLTGAPLIAPPPVRAAPIALPAGWGVAHPLGVYVDACGYICLNGQFTNNNTFTPGGNQVFTLDPGYRPATNKFFRIAVHLSIAVVECSVRPDGSFWLDGSSGSIVSGSIFELGAVRFHPTA